MIPIYKPYINKYKTSALKSIEDEWISNYGIYVDLASDKLCQILNIKHCILMNNGTSATQCLYKALLFNDNTLLSLNSRGIVFNIDRVEQQSPIDNVFIVNPCVNMYEQGHKYYDLAQSFIGFPLLHYKTIIINASKIYLCNSSFFVCHYNF